MKDADNFFYTKFNDDKCPFYFPINRLRIEFQSIHFKQLGMFMEFYLGPKINKQFTKIKKPKLKIKRSLTFGFEELRLIKKYVLSWTNHCYTDCYCYQYKTIFKSIFLNPISIFNMYRKNSINHNNDD